MWRPCRLLVGLVLASSATAVEGFAAGMVNPQLCGQVAQVLANGQDVFDVMSDSFEGQFSVPEACDLNIVYEEICNEAGFNCEDQFIIPEFPKLNEFTTQEFMAAIEPFTELIDQYTACWGPGGGLRPAAVCVDSSIFTSLREDLSDRRTRIQDEIIAVNDEINDNNGNPTELNQKRDALRSAAESVAGAVAVTEPILGGDGPSDSTNSGGGSSGENSGGDGGGEVDAGVVAGAVVGGIAGVGLVVYALDKTNVITLPRFSAATGANVNVASAFYSEEASAFI